MAFNSTGDLVIDTSTTYTYFMATPTDSSTSYHAILARQMQRRHSFLHQSMTGYSYPAIGKPGLYIRSTDMQLSGIHTFAEKITISSLN